VASARHKISELRHFKRREHIMSYEEGSRDETLGRAVIGAGFVVALVLCVLIPWILVR
jgi:hypothetical protein